MRKYDAIVIGAGPAGSSFAHYAAKSGLKVLLVEKQKEVAHNIFCAEGVSKDFLEMIEKDGFERNYIASYIYGGILTYNGEPYVEVTLNEPGGAVLERKIFDRYLVERAVRAGSDILVNAKFIGAERDDTGVRIHIKSGGKQFIESTPLIIGADGPASAVSKSLGLFQAYDREDDFYTYQVYGYCEGIKENYLYFGVGEEVAPKGYAWIFPKGGGFANIGVGIPGDGKNLEHYLGNFLKKHCLDFKILGVTHGVVPTGFHKRRLYADNVLILGDAARLADPLTGGGIANAYISGKAAAHAAKVAYERGDFTTRTLKLYKRNLKKIILYDYMITLYVRIFYRSLVTKELESFMESMKESLNELHIKPPMRPVAMLYRVLKRDPFFLFKFGKKGLYAAKETLREFI